LRLKEHSSLGELELGSQLQRRPDYIPEPTPMKRALDIFGASIALVLFGPLILLMCWLTKRQDGENAIFAQDRVARHGRTFRCYKIRSMVPNAGQVLAEILKDDAALRIEWDLHQKLENDPRVTRLGAFMRKTSIDELPQLVNILRGDMSFVGPRPIVHSEISKYGDEFVHYCSVRPGLTGKWQVEGRSNTGYAERILLDSDYARERTFWGDINIMLKTVPAVLKGDGAR